MRWLAWLKYWREHESDVIRYAIKECGIQDLDDAVMVGDRENDVSAAGEVGLDSIGVLYGYGDEEELTKAGATYLAQTAKAIEALVWVLWKRDTD